MAFSTDTAGDQPQACPRAACSDMPARAEAVKAVGDASKHKEIWDYIAKTGWWKWDENHVMRAGGDVPIAHYQVQGGEPATIFTDPPTKPYKNFMFQVPRWIKK